MRRAMRAGTALLGLLVAAQALGAGCKKSSEKKKSDRDLEHRAGIPVIPRGKVVLATATGERYLLEIHARITLPQAVAFYRNQLQLEHWKELKLQKVEPGLWGLTARRGIFELTGRIKLLKSGLLSIGFERVVRKEKSGWTPPVPKDVPVLADRVQWTERVFQRDSNRVEIRGRSSRKPAALGAAFQSALTKHGWTVSRAKQTIAAKRTLRRSPPPEQVAAESKQLRGRGWTVTISPDGKQLTAERSLDYTIEGTTRGALVRLRLSLDELKPHKSAAASSPTRPTGVDAGTVNTAPAENLAPLPKDLMLWPTKRPVLGRKLSEDIYSFSLTRPCESEAKLLAELGMLLRKRGYKRLARAGQPVQGGTVASKSMTFLKGKRVVVAIVNKEPDLCTVQLTVARSGAR